MRKFLAVLFAGVLGALAGLAPAHSAYPEKVVKLVVPYAAGGANDIFARFIAQELSVRWKQQVIIENRPGGSATIGGQAVATSPADGYTLLVATSTFAAHPALFPKLPYDMKKDFVTVAKVVDAPVLLIAHPDVPITTAGDLVAYVKRSPVTINYGTAGNASTPHLTAELFNAKAGIKMTHVPYKGDNQAILGVMNGSVPVAFTSVLAALPQVRAGKLKAIGISTLIRVEQMPETPTIAESGLPGYELAGWYSLLAPAGTPPAIVNFIADAVRAIVTDPEGKKRMNSLGVAVAFMGPEEFKAYMASEITKLTAVVNDAKISAE